MGGCIGLRTLLERSDFAAAVFSAPMWRLHMKAATRELTARMTRLAYLAGLGARLTPGARAEPTAVAIGYPGNPLTSDPQVFAWCLDQITAHPELALGGPSMQWTSAALQEMARLAIAPLPVLPTLVLLGGVETVVSSATIRRQVAQMARGELAEFPAARHEIFMERPEIVAEVWARIDRFLDGVAGERRAAPGGRSAADAGCGRAVGARAWNCGVNRLQSVSVSRRFSCRFSVATKSSATGKVNATLTPLGA